MTFQQHLASLVPTALRKRLKPREKRMHSAEPPPAATTEPPPGVAVANPGSANSEVKVPASINGKDMASGKMV